MYNVLGAGGFNSGNQRIHYTPLVVKTNLIPILQIAGYAIKLKGWNRISGEIGHQLYLIWMLYKGCAQIETTISWATCPNHYLKLPLLKRSKVSLIRVAFHLHIRMSIASYYVTLITLGRVFCYLHNTKQRFYTIETSINPWIPEYQPEQTTLLILQLQPEQSFKGRITQRERQYNGNRIRPCLKNKYCTNWR